MKARKCVIRCVSARGTEGRRYREHEREAQRETERQSAICASERARGSFSVRSRPGAMFEIDMRST